MADILFTSRVNTGLGLLAKMVSAMSLCVPIAFGAVVPNAAVTCAECTRSSSTGMGALCSYQCGMPGLLLLGRPMGLVCSHHCGMPGLLLLGKPMGLVCPAQTNDYDDDK